MDRRTVYCIVEGQTENAVLKELLGAHLAGLGIDFHAPIVETRGGKGGVKYLRLEHLVKDIQRFLGDKRLPLVTTFFDFYALPEGESKGWGFIAEAKELTASHGKPHVVAQIEKGIADHAVMGSPARDAAKRFIPYIQLHELESFFFAEPHKLAEALESPNLERMVNQAVQECGGCEQINDRTEFAPSKRIERVATHYIKGRSNAAHGPILAKKLDLRIVREKCPRFGAWVKRLEESGLC